MIEESPVLSARHLLVCEEVIAHETDAKTLYSLENLVITVGLTPPKFPFCIEKLHLFFQLFGTPGEYSVWFDLVFVDDIQRTTTRVCKCPPRTLNVLPDSFVTAFGVPVFHLIFDRPGTYEFRLWVEGFDGPLLEERILAEA